MDQWTDEPMDERTKVNGPTDKTVATLAAGAGEAPRGCQHRGTPEDGPGVRREPRGLIDESTYTVLS